MKYGLITKSLETDKQKIQADMALINQYTRKELNPEDVYVFSVAMCNNEIDRDIEKFTIETLKQLAVLFKGKTMIFDHNPSASNQVARIFDTYIEENPTQKTSDGETYATLVGKIYMLNNNSNKELIDSIDAGILKEVSVSCSASELNCSICGTNQRKKSCNHYKGKEYNGKMCFYSLEKAEDAYELSLVAIPAQKDAGITKMLNNEKGDVISMEIKEKIKEQFGVEIADTDTLDTALEKVSKAFDGMSGEIVVKEDGTTEITCKGKILATLPAPVVSELGTLKEFISADVVKAKAGKELTADEVLSIVGDYETLKSKATEFDTLKSEAIDTAIKNGIKAKGERFNKDVNEKILKGLSYGEVIGMSKEWESDAVTALNAGKHLSGYGDGKTNKSIDNIDDFKL